MIDRPVIEVTNLVKRFGDFTVLDGVDISVPRGQTLVILGRSGTGKSVLLKILIGLLDPTGGNARILDTSFARLSQRERLGARRQIGYVFQGGALFDSLNVLDNVGFPLHQRRVANDIIVERARERLAMVGLGHAAERLPNQLSGGMQKRVALARALIDLPEVMLYDEPTSGLDPLTTDVINQIILRLRSRLGVTSVVVTHDISSAMTIADRIVMLDRGRVVAAGTPAEIQANTSSWVQHFLRGQALESEMLDSGSFNRPGGLTGSRRMAAADPSSRGSSRRLASVKPTSATAGGETRLRQPIRNRGSEPSTVSTQGTTAATPAQPAHASKLGPAIRLRRPRSIDPTDIAPFDPDELAAEAAREAAAASRGDTEAVDDQHSGSDSVAADIARRETDPVDDHDSQSEAP